MPKFKNSNATFWVIFKHCANFLEMYDWITLSHRSISKYLQFSKNTDCPWLYIIFTTHTDAKSQFLFKNSILMKSTPTLNLNFPAKNGIFGNLIIWTKIGILPQCALLLLSRLPLEKSLLEKWIFLLNPLTICYTPQ